MNMISYLKNKTFNVEDQVGRVVLMNWMIRMNEIVMISLGIKEKKQSIEVNKSSKQTTKSWVIQVYMYIEVYMYPDMQLWVWNEALSYWWNVIMNNGVSDQKPIGGSQ